MKKIKIIKSKILFKILGLGYIVLGFLVGVVLFGLIVPETTNADLPHGFENLVQVEAPSYKVVKKIKMVITAYTSTPDQTDDTPFITASNKMVADGIIANNMLSFGTKVRIPELYGEKVFVVEDRMHKRKGLYHADIWMEELQDAKNFGAKVAYIEVVEDL